MKHFVLTIARGYGSGGRTIGKMLAQSLGVNFYDRDLLKMASTESGINEELFAQADETAKNSLLYRIARNTYKNELIPPDHDDFISNENLFNYQAKIIKELAEQESCIIIGRCADYILKDRPDILRVYIYAPLNACIENLRPYMASPDKEIKKQIHTIDKRRAAYYHYFTGNDWEDAKNYDLCLNSAQLGYEKCVQLIEAYLKIKCLED